MKNELKAKASSARRQVLLLCGVLLVIALGYASWLARRAHRNLVTLDVRDMEVRQVVKKISWQTWEDIFVRKDVQGKVTLRVRNMPLEQVLRLVGDQTFSRSSALYPLYSKGESFTRLKKSLRGEVDPAMSGWTNLQARAFGGGPPMPGFNMPGQPQNQFLSFNIVAKDLAFATLAFNRFAQARVVPEDGASATVTLSLKRSTVPAAVSRLAKAAHFKWATVYALQGGWGPGGPFAGAGGFGGPREGGPRGPGEFGGPRDGRDTNGPGRRGFGGPEMNEAQRDEMRQQRELLEAELRQALPAEERQKMEQAQQEREEQMQAMANMTPEQRAQQFAQRGGGPGMDKMNRDRIMNSTPEQRAARRGPGGPGGGPRGPR